MNLPKLLDCTIRDGGYINNWQFEDSFVHALHRAASHSGCDTIELGFFDPHRHTKGTRWTHLSGDDLRHLKQQNPDGCRISVMINHGSVKLSEVPHQDEYPADLIRIAAPRTERVEATRFAAELSAKGYDTTINYMGISNYSDAEIGELVGLMNDHKDGILYFYLADSFGSLLPRRTREIFDSLRSGTDVQLGFHPHNNLQLAFANCLEAMEADVSIIDGSIYGMGRGAGNLFTESILAYFEQLESERYRLTPLLQFADLFMEEMKESYDWGYSLPQLLSGIFHCHPNYPTNLIKQKSYTADDIYLMLKDLPATGRSRHSGDEQERIRRNHLLHLAEHREFSMTPSLETLRDRSANHALLVCGGTSVAKHESDIRDFIEQHQPSTFSVNHPTPPIPVDGVYFGNRRRLLQYCDQISDGAEVIFGTAIHEDISNHFELEKVSRTNPLKLPDLQDSAFRGSIPTNSAVEAILGLVQMGYKKISICGLDGYREDQSSHYYPEHDAVAGASTITEQNRVIEEELDAARELASRMGFEFTIITPTLFSSHRLS